MRTLKEILGECAILDSSNKNTCDAWQRYRNKSYGPMEQTDLTSFTWFYNEAPNKDLIDKNLEIVRAHGLTEKHRDKFVHINTDGGLHPERFVQAAGAFVHTEPPTKDEFLEVIRTNRGQGLEEYRDYFIHRLHGKA